MHLRTMTVGFAALVTATCSEGAPTAPDKPSVDLTAAATTEDPRAATAAAVDDSRERIVPELRAVPGLGALPATKDLAAALDDLAAALAQPRGSLDKAIRRATQAISTLEDAVKTDGGRAANLTVVRLAVEQARALGHQ